MRLNVQFVQKQGYGSVSYLEGRFPTYNTQIFLSLRKNELFWASYAIVQTQLSLHCYY